MIKIKTECKESNVIGSIQIKGNIASIVDEIFLIFDRLELNCPEAFYCALALYLQDKKAKK